MQEEVENKTVALAINGTKLTAHTLKSAILKYLAARKNKQIQELKRKELENRALGLKNELSNFITGFENNLNM